jgi:hypothetical protein
METLINFGTQVTRIMNIGFDQVNNLILVYYVNYNESYFYTKSKLNGEHYIQVYDNEYNVVADLPVDGRLLFVSDGNVYLHTEESEERFVIKVYQLK